MRLRLSVLLLAVLLAAAVLLSRAGCGAEARALRGDGDDGGDTGVDETGPSGADGSESDDDAPGAGDAGDDANEAGGAGGDGSSESSSAAAAAAAAEADEGSAPLMPDGNEGAASSESSAASSGSEEDGDSSQAGPSMDEVMNGLLSGRIKTGKAQLTVALGNKNYHSVTAHKTDDKRREQRIKKKMAATAEDMQEQGAKLAAEQTRKLRDITNRERVAEGHNKAFELALRQKNKQHEEKSEEATEKRVAREKAMADTLEMEKAAAKEEIRLRKKKLDEGLELAESTFEKRIKFARQRAVEQARKQIKRGTLDAERIARRAKYEEAAKERAFVARQQADDRRQRKQREQDNKSHLGGVRRRAHHGARNERRGHQRAEQSRKRGLQARRNRWRRSEQARKSRTNRRQRSEQAQKRRHPGQEARSKASLRARHARVEQARQRHRTTRQQRERTEQGRKSEQLAKRKPRWHVIASRACFNARSTQGDTKIVFPRSLPGRGSLPHTVTVKEWKLTHVAGGVSCATSAPLTKWGCGDMLGVYIKSQSPSYRVAPGPGTASFVDLRHANSWYRLTGYSPTTQMLVFKGNYKVYTGRTLTVSYGEALTGYTTGDNRGQTCARVEAFF